VPRSSTDTKLIEGSSAPLKHRGHYDIRTNPLLGVVVPEDRHERTNTNSICLCIVPNSALSPNAL
jgi:hypothetical protein